LIVTLPGRVFLRTRPVWFLQPAALLSARLPKVGQHTSRVRSCVIFNPVARGEKAGRFRRYLEVMAASCALKNTAAPDDARRLATEAVREGFELVIAAGGDGTLNEVLNGISDAPEGFDRVCLGFVPLGTVNVFARELGIPLSIEKAWSNLSRGREQRIDLPFAEFLINGTKQRRYFAQLGGAGLDARAIELVSWSLKKKIGPLAYVLAGLKALKERHPLIKAAAHTQQAPGELVLIGNGQLYGGDYRLLPNADLRDGLLDVCVFPRVGWLTLARCSLPLLVRGKVPDGVVRRFQAKSFTLTSESAVPFELDGEPVGHLPANFSVERERLRVIAP